MSLHDSEMLALAASAHPSNQTAVAAASVTAGQAAFAERVLRLRADSRLLLLCRPGCPPLFPENELHRSYIGVSLLDCAPSSRGTPQQTLRASLLDLPFGSASFDAVAEFETPSALTLESDDEAIALLLETARVLRSSSRYLCGGGGGVSRTGSSISADKRRTDEWRNEGRDRTHHTMGLMRPDGSWQRWHERLRFRSFDQVEALFTRSGFSVINAFEDYDQRRQARYPDGSAILLCQKV